MGVTTHTPSEEREAWARKILDRGVVVGVLPDRESFVERLASTTPLRIYIGADPTATALHLSHAKNYLLLEEFRQLGHEVIVLFGDFTARIGDPTDRLAARRQLSAEEIKVNVEKWLDQIRPLMDFDAVDNPPQIKFNAEWLSALTMEEVINLASQVTVQRMLERDMFEKRLQAEQPIHLHEFLYPLLQGYDSVALEVDAELCGTDQTFNALMGRTLLKNEKQRDKFVVTVHLMENPKTGELMSKSRGTGVFLDTDAFDMYGSIMSEPDEMTEIILVNNTRLELEDIATIMQAENPRDAKMRAAFEVTRLFHGEAAAQEAKERFVSLVQNDEPADNVPEIAVPAGTQTLFSIVRTCLEDEVSNGQIRRLFEQGSVKVDGEKETDWDKSLTLDDTGVLLKVGKKKWFRVRGRETDKT